MLGLTVGESAVGSGLLTRLQREVGFLQQIGLEAALTRYQCGNRFFYHCHVSRRGDDGSISPEMAEIVRSSIAAAVSETVLQEIEPLILLQIISRLRPGYRPEERARVATAAKAIAERLGADAFSERNRVVDRIVDYLSDQSLLQVDGFVRFRLKEYCDELIDCVRQAVDDLEVEKERQEFVALLKDFVDGRPAGVQVVHILPGENELFRLVDQRGIPVEPEAFEEDLWELVDDGQVDMEELLITALVSIAPGRVVCHRPIETRDIPMVSDVFTGRIDACSGCELCQGLTAPTARPRPH